MTIVYSIRGTNGSGKSTLVREFVPTLTGDLRGGPVNLNPYPSPTKREPERQKRAKGYCFHTPDLGSTGVIGSYRTACGGLDSMNSFAVQQDAIMWMINVMAPRHILAEGILASTVYGSWSTFAAMLGDLGHQYVWCYLDTPLDICLERIRARQEAAGRVREIKTDLVADKIKAIASTRERALKEGGIVYDIPFQIAKQAMRAIMLGEGKLYRV